MVVNEKEENQRLCASMKITPFPVYLVLRALDDKTAKERDADGVTSKDGKVLFVDISLRLTRREAVPVLAHEICHVIDFLEEIIEDELNGEVRAYLTGSILEWMNGVFCAWRKR